MAESEKEIDYRSPLGVTTDEIGDSTVKVSIVIPGVKKQSMRSGMANGSLKVQFQSRSFEVKVQLDSNKNGRKTSDYFRCHIKRLPQEILPERSTYKIEKDKIVLTLLKAKPLSWAGDLDSRGLEMDESD